jgi:hypothetical protein
MPSGRLRGDVCAAQFVEDVSQLGLGLRTELVDGHLGVVRDLAAEPECHPFVQLR